MIDGSKWWPSNTERGESDMLSWLQQLIRKQETKAMTEEQRAFIERWADTVEQNPKYYNQATNPYPSGKSRGCLIHFGNWLLLPEERTLEEATGLSEDDMETIYWWRGPRLDWTPTAKEGADYLRSFIK